MLYCSAQCEIIQGRLEGKLLEPSGRYSVLLFFFAPLLQHPQPGPWVLVRLGLSAERSLVSCARLVPVLRPEICGTLNNTRGAD
jgi:hypothetical protein